METRTKEGENLKNDILGKLDVLNGQVACVEERSPQIVAEYREKLEDKMKELLADSQIEESRIAAEVILFADKICTDEEVVRLKKPYPAYEKYAGGERGGSAESLILSLRK